jgi:putative hydrolase of the HAD superfamily
LQDTYKHIFFDLDHTLWDFTSNSRKTLETLFDEFDLQKKGVSSFSEFVNKYETINEGLWAKYRIGAIDKITLRNGRFPAVFKLWEIEDQHLSDSINERYLTDGPKQSGLMPNAIETLNYLQDRYEVHLITNGFKEVQATKLGASGLNGYFKTITTSEEVGVLKPNPKVFYHALDLASAIAPESIYVGDHFESDVLGSKDAGIDQVFFNPHSADHPKIATFEIQDLGEMIDIF